MENWILSDLMSENYGEEDMCDQAISEPGGRLVEKPGMMMAFEIP